MNRNKITFDICWLDWEGNIRSRTSIECHDISSAINKAAKLIKNHNAYGFHVIRQDRLSK
jgi:hypothetical protein